MAYPGDRHDRSSDLPGGSVGLRGELGIFPCISRQEDAFGLRQPFRYPSGAEDEQAVGQVSDLRRGKRGAGL